LKLYNKIQKLKHPSTRVNISEEIANLLGVGKSSQLHGFILNRKNRKDIRSPEKSIVLCPFPISAWNNLIRMSVTLPPRKNMLNLLHAALNKVYLYCRHFESTNGLDLSGYQVHIRRGVGNKGAIQRQGDFIIPSTFLCVEVPERVEDVGENIFGPGCAEKSCERRRAYIEKFYDLRKDMNRGVLTELYINQNGLAHFTVDKVCDTCHLNLEILIIHVLIRRMIDFSEEFHLELSSSLRNVLLTLMKGGLGSDDLKIDWINPMSTLNRLGNKAYYSKDDKEAVYLRAIGRKKFNVQRDDIYFIDLASWQSVIWDPHTKIPDEIDVAPKSYKLMIGHGDSAEKLICWDIFSQDNFSVLELSLLSPLNGLEHVWWQFVYSSIDRAGGNILTAHSTLKLSGHWGRIDLAVLFPDRISSSELIKKHTNRFKLKKKIRKKKYKNLGIKYKIHVHISNIKNVIGCLKELQGEELDSPKYKMHLDTLSHFKHQIHGLLEGLKDKEDLRPDDDFPRSQSTLEVRKVWDPKSPGERVAINFKTNPYQFTKPHKIQYNNKYHHQTRLKLAEDLYRELIEGKNIAVIGAHRVGKTSIINMIKSFEETEDNKGPRIISVNGSTTPPYTIFYEIINQIEKIEDESKKKIFPKIWNGFSSILEKYNPNISKLHFEIMGFKVGADFPSNDKQQEENFSSSESLKKGFQNIITSMHDSSEHLRLDFLKDCLNQLNDSFKKVPYFSFIFIIDEVGDFLNWGRDSFLPVWRSAIESEEYKQIKWLISATKPIEESLSFSPITNVFRECNLTSLGHLETELLLDLFDHSEDGSFTTDKPVLTYQARVLIRKISSQLPYFLQVILYHLYNYVTRYFYPVANRQACRYVIKTYVLPELSDYIHHQWYLIPDIIRDNVCSIIDTKNLKDANTIYYDNDYEYLTEYHLPAKAKIALIRSGLKGEDDYIMAPIVLLWLKENDSAFEN
jgi:hypothetical protein